LGLVLACGRCDGCLAWLQTGRQIRWMSWKTPFSLAIEAFNRSLADNVAVLAAGLAFYALISIAPLLVITISLAGLVFGEQAAEGQIVGELGELIGREGAVLLQEMIRRTSRPGASVTAAVLGVLVLLFGASRLFGALETSLNGIWGVRLNAPAGVVAGALSVIKYRFLSFLMVLGTGFLLLVSLVISAALAAAQTYFSDALPGWGVLWQWLSALVNFGITTLMFAAILRGVPDLVLRWRDVVVGALVTSVLFSIGRFLMGLYLGQGSFASAYGAAGSLVILLFWLYYSAQILLLGAEFTKVYAEHRGVRPRTRMGATLAPRS
jgi:membrane protein